MDSLTIVKAVFLKGAVVNDATLLPRLSTAGDHQLQQDVGPKFAYLMVCFTVVQATY